MRKLISFSALVILFSCSKPKDDDSDPAPAEQKQYTYRAKSITYQDYRFSPSGWSYDAQGRVIKFYVHQAEFDIFYNADGTIKNFVGRNTMDNKMAGGMFRYSGGKLVRVLLTRDNSGLPANSSWFADSASSFSGYYHSIQYNADNSIKSIVFNSSSSAQPYGGTEYFYKVGNDSTYRVQSYHTHTGSKVIDYKLEFVSNNIPNPFREIPFLSYMSGNQVPAFVISYPWHANVGGLENNLGAFPYAISSFKAYAYNYNGSLNSADSSRFRYRYALDSTAIYIKHQLYNADSTTFGYDKIPK